MAAATRDPDLRRVGQALADDDRFHLHFALDKACEDRALAEQSFIHYAAGNRLRRATRA